MSTFTNLVAKPSPNLPLFGPKINPCHPQVPTYNLPYYYYPRPIQYLSKYGTSTGNKNSVVTKATAAPNTKREKSDERVQQVHGIEDFDEGLRSAKNKLVVVEYAASHRICSSKIYPFMVDLSRTCNDVEFLLVLQVTEIEIVSPPSPRPLPLVSTLIEPETDSSSSSKSLPLVPLDQGNSGDVYESCSNPSSSSILEKRLDDVSLALPPIPADLPPSNLTSPHLSPGPSVFQKPIEPTTMELVSDEAIHVHQEPTIQPDIPEAATSSDFPEDPNTFLELLSKFNPLRQPTPLDASRSYEANRLIEQLKHLSAIPFQLLSTSQVTEIDGLIQALLSNASTLSLEQTGFLLTNQSDITSNLRSLQLLHQEISQDEGIIQSYEISDSSLSSLTFAFQSQVNESNDLEAQAQRLMQELASVREKQRIIKQNLAVQTKEIKQVMDRLKADAASVASIHKNMPLKEIRYQLLLNKWENFKAQMNL